MNALHPYSRVNEALNKVFFDGRFAGQPVYLSLDNEMRQEIADALGWDQVSVEDLICASVRRTFSPNLDPYARYANEMRIWRRAGMRTPPPFTAVLFCLSHAAALMAAEDDFASTNYYRRLTQVTGLPRETLTEHRKSTDLFWKYLAEWLLKNNHAFGKPTARSTSPSRRYVGKAMSQAIVRASDREHFHGLFEKFGFTGGEAITPKEMEHYLAHWMAGSGPSQRLRRAWQIQDLRERVAEAAIAELSTWAATSGTSGTIGSRPARLLLLANLTRRLGGARLELQLGRVAEGMEAGPLKLVDSSQTFFLANNDYGGIATISPPAIGRSGEGLGHSFEFRHASGSISGFDWHPRLVIPLAMHPQASVWTEVPRVSFGVPHMILVRDAKNMPAQVEFYLAQVCMSPPQRAEATQLNGLPRGWVLYQDVQVRKLAEPPSDVLDCLFPFGAEGSFTMEGGLQMLPGFYHASIKPHANFIATTGPTSVQALAEEDGEPVASAGCQGPECSLEVDPTLFSPEGNVYLSARQGESDPIDKQVFFRDANRPHPGNFNQKGRLAYNSLVSASQWQEASAEVVEGLVFSGSVPATSHESLDISRSLPVGDAEAFQNHSVSLILHGTAQTCIERGYHHTRYPAVPPNSPPGTMVEGECLGCKRRDVVVYRRKSNAAPREFQRLPLPTIAISAAANITPIDYKILLDALCFLGNGSWAKFQSLLEAWGEGTRPARQVAHDLFLLGFLDLELRPGTNAVRSWSVPPPSLHFVESGKAYLAGFRCKSLLAEIGVAVAAAGGTFTVEDCEGRPDIAWVEGLSVADASSTLDGVEDPLGRPITVHEATGLMLAAACSVLEGMEASTTPVSIGQPRNLQWFDIEKVRWLEVDEVRKAGAYRWNDGLQCYAHVSPGGEGVAGPYQVVKLLAARQQGIVLHMHDRASECFLSTLGCEPPGLLERALVACSGLLPIIRGGMTSYAQVDARVAGLVLNNLYPREHTHEARQSSQRH